MRKLSRLEANKEVRRVLNRHGVDLGYCQFSVGGMDIRMTGWLCKTDESDFNGSQIGSIIQELLRILPGYSVSGDFENWNFTSDYISKLGDSSNDSDSKQEEEQERYDIGLEFDPEAS
jgi:hypothetical protein